MMMTRYHNLCIRQNGSSKKQKIHFLLTRF